MKHHFNLILVIALLLLTNCSSNDDESPVLEEIGAPLSISVFDIGNDEDSGDVRVFFTPGTNSEEVQEYRVLFVRTEVADMITVDDLLSLNSNRYLTHPGNGTLKLNLVNGILDTDGNAIANGIQYHLILLAVPKSADVSAQMRKSSLFVLTDKELKDVYISSNKTNSVELFDGVTGEHIKSFVPNGLGGLGQTQEVIFLEDGSLLVTGLSSTALKRYDGVTGEFLGDFTSGYTLSQPTKTNIGPDGHIYVSQWNANQNSIVRFNLETGEFIDEVVPSFFQGMDQAWDSEGNFYVVSWGLAELRKYNAQFALLASTESNLSGPVNIWIDNSDVIFVVDWTAGDIKRYNTNLEYMDTFITVGSRIEGFVFDGNQLYICDWANSKVNIYNATSGDLIRTFINSSKIEEANGITFGPDQRPI